jgi:23S rRNA pseudouridine955/2504/2580 synthase
MKMNIKKIILFENEDYFAIDKPPNISTLDDRQSTDNLLVMARGVFDTPKVCHRLDKETSGILVFAKNEAAYAHLAMQFERRKVRKVYHAITNGSSQYSNYLIDLPLRIPNSGPVKVSKKDGKSSRTIINTLDSFRYHSLIECLPESGRKHQIRVHLASLGLPVCSDSNYGGKDLLLSTYKKNFKGNEKPLIRRVALHACILEFMDMENREILLEAPYPKDFQIALKQLRKYNR